MRLICKWAMLLSLFAGLSQPLSYAQASALTLQAASMTSAWHTTSLFSAQLLSAQLLSARLPGPNKQSELAIKSPQQAMQRVRSQFQAKVLTIQSSQVNGNPGYRVKLLTPDGEVFYVLVDAKTGAVIRN